MEEELKRRAAKGNIALATEIIPGKNDGCQDQSSLRYPPSEIEK